MRPSQRARYAERIERVIRHLGSLEADAPFPRLADLAAIAAYSPFHFHRVFRLMTGETLGEAVRRIRLARSLPALSAEDMSVTSAAGLSGYATSQGYARALRACTEMSPSEARRSQAAASELNAALARSPSSGLPGRPPMSVEVVSIDPFKVVAIRNVGDHSELNLAYERLFANLFSRIGIERLRGIYGIPIDDPATLPADQCHFDCAVLIDGELDETSDLRMLELGGGLHARLRHTGPLDHIQATIDRLYETVLDAADIRLAEAPPHIHYLDDPDQVPEHRLRADIFLPIEKGR